jgi:hypothetical protein
MDSADRTTDQCRIARSFSPFVVGENVHVERGGGIAFIAKQQLTVERGGGQWLVSGGNLDIRQGGGVALVARTARVESGSVGALVAWNVHLAPGVRVLLRATPAMSIATVLGFVAGWMLRGRRRSHRIDAGARPAPR